MSTCEASCTQYSNTSPVRRGIGDQAARVRPEPGEQRQLLAAHQHVDRVDLDQPDAVEHAAEVTPVDTSLRPGIGEALAAANAIRRAAASETFSATTSSSVGDGDGDRVDDDVGAGSITAIGRDTLHRVDDLETLHDLPEVVVLRRQVERRSDH